MISIASTPVSADSSSVARVTPIRRDRRRVESQLAHTAGRVSPHRRHSSAAPTAGWAMAPPHRVQRASDPQSTHAIRRMRPVRLRTHTTRPSGRSSTGMEQPGQALGDEPRPRIVGGAVDDLHQGPPPSLEGPLGRHQPGPLGEAHRAGRTRPARPGHRRAGPARPRRRPPTRWVLAPHGKPRRGRRGPRRPVAARRGPRPRRGRRRPWHHPGRPAPIGRGGGRSRCRTGPVDPPLVRRAGGKAPAPGGRRSRAGGPPRSPAVRRRAPGRGARRRESPARPERRRRGPPTRRRARAGRRPRRRRRAHRPRRTGTGPGRTGPPGAAMPCPARTTVGRTSARRPIRPGPPRAAGGRRRSSRPAA